jgi:UDP-N-acetylglucosamine 4,6-dehydratase/5-epimerase
MFENKRILITGGTGSWGNALTKRILEENPKEIIIFSRGEFAQVTMKRKFNNPKLNFIIGDVSDYESIKNAMKNVDYVFHLAALKHVPICENQPYEAIKTNILGTFNVSKVAVEESVKKVIDVSSDKAVDPLNTYGMTKAIGERIFINANNKESLTKFICIRAGNVVGTNGSVIPLWTKQILEKNRITVTDFNMTRYYMDIKEAIDLLLKAAEIGIGGETFVMRMPSLKMEDLAKFMFKYLKGIEIDKSNVEEVGILPGEKIHEVLISRNEAKRTKIFNDTYFIILPYNLNNLKEYYGTLPDFKEEEYGSNTQEFMNEEKMISFLDKNER